MDKKFYINLARSGLSFPMAAHLVLHEENDPEAVMHDGKMLGRVVEQTARRYNTPLANPLMDLEVEKQAVMEALSVPEDKRFNYHLAEAPSDKTIHEIIAFIRERMSQRMTASCEAISYIAASDDLLPIGMCIGPFSLMTKFLSDPITPVYMFGMGMSESDDPGIAMMRQTLKLSENVIQGYMAAQIDAGAKAILVCEPAANIVYISPNQLEAGSDVFDRCVMDANIRLKNFISERGVDLFLHDCGEINEFMVKKMASIEPAVLSLGSSQELDQIARVVSKNIVLYGNLPSKSFYSDKSITKEDVISLSEELIEKMSLAEHPFILGTECDVLSVEGYNETIKEKIDSMCNTMKKSISK